MTKNLMAWVNLLPEVGAPILKDRQDLRELLSQADDLERCAAQLRESVRRGEAALKTRILKHWSQEEVERAEARAVAAAQGQGDEPASV